MSRLPALMRLHEEDPGDPTLLYMIAQEHVNAGQREEALVWLRRYVERGDDVGAAWALLADCHERLGDLPAAAEALRSGIANARRCGHPSMAAELEERLAELE